MNLEWLGGLRRSKVCLRACKRELRVFAAIGVAAMTMSEGAESKGAPQRAIVDYALQTAIERKDIPGVVAMAVDRHGVIYQGAFGTADASAGRAMTVDAIFNIASMTKPITTVA